MGGHGGLNILPQKRWNVYNFDNREKVRQDEEAAAKEEQLKREDSRKRDAEFRLERLRTARGLAPLIPEPQAADPAPSETAEPTPAPAEDNGNHINLFEGIRIFDLAAEAPERSERREKSEERSKKRAKKEEVRVVTAEDEKYRLGYGLAGKGVKVPWYLEKKGRKGEGEEKENGEERFRYEDNVEKKRKKSLEELREERLKREEREKKRERDLLRGKGGLPKDGERLKRRDDGSGSRLRELGKSDGGRGSRYFSTRWNN